MTDETVYAYAGDITKTYDEDGQLIVVGKATGPDLDLDEQVCDPTWLKSAMPAWMQFGNLREMHSPIAAGIGLELSNEGDDWHLKSRVIDEGTKAKIEAGLLKGYSIGIKGAKVVKDASAPRGRIVGGNIVEVSYVDRPCNPTAVTTIAKGVGLTETVEAADAERTYDYEKAAGDPSIEADWKPEDGYQPKDESEYPGDHQCATCDGLGKLPETGETCPKCDGTGHAGKPEEPGINPGTVIQDPKAADAETEKREYSEDERAQASSSGAALPDGSYPIKTVADLKNAIQSFGRAKDPAKVKAHIKTRAAALNREDLIPENWKGADADLEKVEHNAADLEAVRQSLIALIKAELDEMAMGEEDETMDVSHLLAALQIFLDWWDGEAEEGETDAPFTMDESDEKDIDMDYMALGVSADIVKAAKAGGDDERDALRAEVVKALGVDTILADIEIAKAAQSEEIELLKAELERVKEMAAPGGPAITRTAGQAYKSVEAERLQSEASRYRKFASEVVDPDLRTMYLSKALEMEADAKKLVSA